MTWLVSVLEGSSDTSSVLDSQWSVALSWQRKFQWGWSLFWVTELFPRDTQICLSSPSLSVGALVFIGFAIGSLFIDPYEENHHVPDVDVRLKKHFFLLMINIYNIRGTTTTLQSSDKTVSSLYQRPNSACNWNLKKIATILLFFQRKVLRIHLYMHAYHF